MVNINCSGKVKEEKVIIELSKQDTGLHIADNCGKLLKPAVLKSILEQLLANSEKEQEQYNNYTINIDNIKISIKHNALNPSLFELAASKIARYLFPKNFAEYKFLIKENMDVNDEIDAGYIPNIDNDIKCSAEQLEGVENVYAAAFYLGLEIRSHKCIKFGDITYLFIDDLSHPFHKVDVKQNKLTDEYRDHKIVPSEKGTLFPITLMNQKCGEWIDKNCDIEKLKDAYERIIKTSQDEINKIIDSSIHVLQSIECIDSQDDSCRSNYHYQYMHDVKEILSDNYEGIKSLMIDVEL